MRWNEIKTLCEICIYEGEMEGKRVCVRYPAYNKNCLRDRCGEFVWTSSFSWGYVAELNSYIYELNRLRIERDVETIGKKKYTKLAKERWHEIKALKQRIKELETEEP